MGQMIQYGNELIRINTQKNFIEYSKDSGRSWHNRCTNTSSGNFIDLLEFGPEIIACTSKGIYYSKDEGRSWHIRYSGSVEGSFLQLSSDGQNILATTSKGLYYSKDSGRSWRRR